MYGENGAEIMVYNVKRNSKKGGEKEKEKKNEGLRKRTVKGKTLDY